MKTIVLIIGTRPNFIKAYPIYNILKNHYNVKLIHSGQHFNKNMSDVFFNQLKFPKPDIPLSILLTQFPGSQGIGATRPNSATVGSFTV